LTNIARSGLISALLFLSLAAAAQTLTGTVTNGTTGKPAAGDEVILIKLGNGMEIGPKTKADKAGKFARFTRT
jgi:5-hydroxyisourate hydrolase-like protein (transthyretin family)